MSTAANRKEHAIGRGGEMIFQVGLPAVVLGLLGGWWLTRRALAPVTKLTNAIKKSTSTICANHCPRTGNGDELDRLTEVFNDMLRGSTIRSTHPRIHLARLARTEDAAHDFVRRNGNRPARRIAFPPPNANAPLSQLDELRRLAHRGRPHAAGQSRRGTGRVEAGAGAPGRTGARQFCRRANPRRAARHPGGTGRCEEISVRGDRHRCASCC
jgi:hypothetical protein